MESVKVHFSMISVFNRGWVHRKQLCCCAVFMIASIQKIERGWDGSRCWLFVPIVWLNRFFWKCTEASFLVFLIVCFLILSVLLADAPEFRIYQYFARKLVYEEIACSFCIVCVSNKRECIIFSLVAKFFNQHKILFKEFRHLTVAAYVLCMKRRFTSQHVCYRAVWV